MKLSVPALVLLATVSLRAADPAPEAAAEKPPLPAAAVEKLNDVLPRYNPPPAPQPRSDFGPKPGEADVLELPKMTVKQQPRPRPRIGESLILGPRAFNEELAKKNLSALDRGVLNKFTIPAWLGGVSAAERAREDYNLDQKRQFMDDVLTIAKAAEQTDPAAAKALREAAAKP